MKVVMSWLREFVDVTASPEELGQTLSMRGFELASVERANIVPSGSDPRTVPGSDPGTDAVLDFEIHANRPDALRLSAMAREAGTAYSLPLRQPAPKKLPATASGDIAVTLEAPDL